MLSRSTQTPKLSGRGTSAFLLILVACVAFGTTVGGDSRWLSVTGRNLLRGAPPLGYSDAARQAWEPVMALATLVFAAVDQVPGERGLLILQLLVVATCLSILQRDARAAGATPTAAAVGLAASVLASLPAFLIVRVQVFSLLLFPMLLSLIRREHRQLSRRVWLIPVLLTLWSNLHGGALLGIAITASYLLLDRVRKQPYVALGVLAVSVTAPLLLTPALWHTSGYYVGLLGNEAARQHVGLWARPELASPFDVLMIGLAVPLVVLAIRARLVAWELVCLTGLVALTAQAARSGVWLTLFCVGPAARPLTPVLSRRSARPHGMSVKLQWLTIAVAVGVVTFAVDRGPVETGASDALIRRAVTLSAGGPIAAEGALGEQVIAAHGCVWVTNPLDAFPRRLQREYLQWSERGDPALLPPDTRVVLTINGSPASLRLASQVGFRLVARDGHAQLHLRNVAPTAPPCYHASQ